MSAKVKANNKDLSKTYQKKSDKEHILDNPDTYVGSVENVETTLYTFDESLNNSRRKGRFLLCHLNFFVKSQ